MDIRFCAITNESIPDGEFEAGRAITVGNKSYYVSAALQRLMARSRLRSWLTFALVLYAAGITTFLLVAELGRTRPDPNAVSVAVADAIRDQVKGLETHLMDAHTGVVQKQIATVNDSVKTLGNELGAAQKNYEQVHLAVSAIAADIDKQEDILNKRFDSMDKRQSRVEDVITDLRQWQIKIEGTADELMRRQAELESTPRGDGTPRDPEPPHGTPVPAPEPKEVDEEHERQVTQWIDRLKDRNNDVVFTATVKLADLGDLRAAMPLVKVLQTHKDFYCRLGAATALGSLKAVDAMDALIDALDDKDELVKTAANEALTAITGEDMGFAPDMSRNERNRVKRKWQTWFKNNEAALRDRLDQPAGTGNG